MKTETPTRPDNFEVYEEYSIYAPAGEVSLENVISLITNAIIYARSQGVSKLLIDGTKLSGFPSPTLAERYWIVRGFAREAGNSVAISFVLQHHLIDPERFGVVVAWNLGVRTDVFTDSAQALSWLLSGAPPTPLTSR